MEASGLGRQWPSFHASLSEAGAPLAAALPPHLPGADASALPLWRQVAQALLTKDGTPRKSLDARAGYPKDFGKTPFASMIRELPEGAAQLLKEVQSLHLTPLSDAEVTALQDLVLILGEVLDVYRKSLEKQMAVDFIDLERAALKLLDTEDPSSLLLRLDLRLKHLLVDEVQDTSVNQRDLLCRLMTGWQGDPHRTFMVVGDPKQSIYGWRQARLRLFLEMREGLRCDAGVTLIPEPLLLSTNFRTSQALIDWVNQVFGKTVMADPAAMEGVAFHPAAPAPDAPPGEPPRLALFPPTEGERESARQREARWLAGELRQAQDDLPPGEKIGVLLFSRTHLTTYLEAFQEAGVLAQVREGLRLGACPAAAHLHNLARALVHPADEAAWAGLLRAPWTAASLEVLRQVAQSAGTLWCEKLERYAAAPGVPPAVIALAAALAVVREQVGRLPLAEVLADFLLQVDGWPALAAAAGPGGVANARLYLDLLARAEAGLPELTLQQTDFAFQEAYQAADPRAQEAPVDILTVHGAKGLEFHTVFLPYLDWQPLRNASQLPPFLLEEIPGANTHGLALAPPYWEQSRGANYRLLQGLRDRRLVAEARRVFYVAATRAKARLVMSGVMGDNKKTSQGPPSGNSPLRWVWSHYHRDGNQDRIGPGLWKDPDVCVEVGPTPSSNPRPPTRLAETPPPLLFGPEPAPYRLVFPSQLTPGPLPEEEKRPPDETAPDSFARARGEVIHALLETLSLDEPLPDAAGVAAALRRVGVPEDFAQDAAPHLLAEVRACRDDPFLKDLLKSSWPAARSEWLLEDGSTGEVRRGVIDRLVFNGQEWWLVDYKTSRPPAGQDWDDFLAREQEKYRPQLSAYREMAARVLGLADPGEIRLLLYFTACQRAVML
jgi:ATP-dependent exoDNAse (exonuclease V) beta subunit